MTTPTPESLAADEALIREQIAAGNMDYQPSGDTAKQLCAIIDALRADYARLRAEVEELKAAFRKDYGHDFKLGCTKSQRGWP